MFGDKVKRMERGRLRPEWGSSLVIKMLILILWPIKQVRSLLRLITLARYLFGIIISSLTNLLSEILLMGITLKSKILLGIILGTF